MAYTVHYLNGPAQGLVLAETATDYVTWKIYSSNHPTNDGSMWDAEAGRYFLKHGDLGDVRQRAEINFGERLATILTANAYNGLKERCEP